eukprot:TRINITY_DN18757_c0_g1_i1.p1 TRINITY_DN18757_c0_g1~~TRINITY_DN18757_c0_g1_i1.p1  ORF type:complete len:416 (-),score=54.87 TRINITY_DN18757_c0_g1_i1:70-1317(-)
MPRVRGKDSGRLPRRPTETEARIFQVLKRVPSGQVITFVELADLAELGSGRGPGIVGRVVRAVASADAVVARRKREREEDDVKTKSSTNGELPAPRFAVRVPARLPWWRVVRGRSEPGVAVEQLVPGPPSRAAAQLERLTAELGLRCLKAPLERKGSQPPDFAKAYFKDCRVRPVKGSQHTATLVYLHGFGGRASRYLRSGTRLPWVEGRLPNGDDVATADFAGLRVVLPTAQRLRQPWGETKPAWYVYNEKPEQSVGSFKSLQVTRRRISALLHNEVARLNGESHRVFIGGLSQGCGVALDAYLREGPRLGLGGFAGVAGWVPGDGDGFTGADAALEGLLASRSQRKRPLWLLLPTDDDKFMPWPMVSASLRRCGRLPGLVSQKVSGRGHGVGDWEGAFLQAFFEAALPSMGGE